MTDPTTGSEKALPWCPMAYGESHVRELATRVIAMLSFVGVVFRVADEGGVVNTHAENSIAKVGWIMFVPMGLGANFRKLTRTGIINPEQQIGAAS